MPEPIIKPNQSCVPGDLQGQAGWFQNWSDQMQVVGSGLGFAVPETDRIKDDNTIVQFIAAAAVTVDAFRTGWTGFRGNMLTKPNGSATPDLPAFSGLSLPSTSSPVGAGIWDRLNHDIDRVRSNLTFTTELGGLLGINPTQPTAPDVGAIQPTVEVFPAAYGMDASIVVSGRQGADQWQVLMAKMGTTDWTVIEVGTGKSVNIHYTPAEGETGPVQLQFRVQLRLNNENYGQVSDIVLATLNP